MCGFLLSLTNADDIHIANSIMGIIVLADKHALNDAGLSVGILMTEIRFSPQLSKLSDVWKLFWKFIYIFLL